MSDGLDIFGAIDTGLASQYITVRVKSIDRAKLESKLGKTGTLANLGRTLANLGLGLVNMNPRAALDVATPLIVNKARDYGVDAEVVVSTIPPSKGPRAYSEFFPGLAIGFVVGGASFAIVKLFVGLFDRVLHRG